jgi:uncharacterized membrane-anchored protein|tara:strand:+ start:1129 stop:1866 length:738 start_codon:yes stop_codon:yes gene_type:complete
MKFSILILFFFTLSCSTHYTKLDNRKPYNSTGFAYIYNEYDYVNKKLKKKLNNELLQISHKDLKAGTLIKLINPKSKETLVLKNFKNIQYPDFYKIIITKPVAIKLNINEELPLIEVLEIKKNKSFIAEKAKIYQEEKKISSKAPVTSVKIANISKKKANIEKINSNNIYIFIASFYTNEAANLLKQRIITEIPKYDVNKLKIKKKNSKEFEVLSGPYKSINLLKNDYIDIKIFGFEELDIFINE